MIKIDGIVVVEGKDDKANLSRIIDANIFVLNGMSGANQKKIDDLKNLAKNNKIYLLTDPDFAGKKIREKINKNIDNIINLYASRVQSTKNSNIGIENLSDGEIIKIFQNIKEIKTDKEDEKYIFTMKDILENRLSKYEDSRQRREVLGDILSISYCNAKQLLKKLNAIKLSYEDFKIAIAKSEQLLEIKGKNAAIFGKFFPAHKGHINFIKYVSKFCENLYVFVCEETIRDEKLNNESLLPNLSIKERKKILDVEIKGYKNIKTIILNEDGIESYPNGWLDWSKRVKESFKSNNIKVDIFFTNEVQDKLNYEKYFEKKAYLVDPNRNLFEISSTKIRQNPEKYIEYMPQGLITLLKDKKYNINAVQK